MVIKKRISHYAQPVQKKYGVGWFSLQLSFIHRIGSFINKSPLYPQIIKDLYTQRYLVCG